MVVFNSSFDGKKLKASLEAHDKKFNPSKTSVKSQKSSNEDTDICRRPKSSSGSDIPKAKKNLAIRPTTVEGETERGRGQIPKADCCSRISVKGLDNIEKYDLNSPLKRKNVQQVEIDFKKNISRAASSDKCSIQVEDDKSNFKEKYFPQEKILEIRHESIDTQKEDRKITYKKPSEIPVLKTGQRASSLSNPVRFNYNSSRVPVKTKKVVKTVSENKVKSESLKTSKRPLKTKREAVLDEKIKEAIKDDFNNLVPLYESEFKKITEVWVNTIYCSLTMRTNLVKLLFQAFPQINKSQFLTEDEKLIHCIQSAKTCTKTEIDNLIHFIKSLLKNREKAKEQYAYMMANRELAEVYRNDWKSLTKKINEMGDKTKQLQLEIPELQKKKEILEDSQREKIKELEKNILIREAELKKLISQLKELKSKDSTGGGGGGGGVARSSSSVNNVASAATNTSTASLSKKQDSANKDLKSDIISLTFMEKEFADVKAKFMHQNEMYEKKIKELEYLLEEKKKTLEKEKEMKQQLQLALSRFQPTLCRRGVTIGREQLEYVLNRSQASKEKRRERLWIAAVKLVLRGFLIQMKKLERDRNKMLLEIQSNDTENFSAIANSLIAKENFIKSVKNQMNDFQKAFNYSKVKLGENSSADGL